MASTDFDRGGHEVVDIAIICMIADTELRAIRHVLLASGAKEIGQSVAYAGSEYFEIRNARGVTIRIVVALCEGQTNVEAAITTQVVLFRHDPRYAFLCGIGGGMKVEKCKLGDVIVAPEVIHRRITKVQDDGSYQAEMVNVPVSPGGWALAKRFFARHPNPKKVQSPYNDGDLFAIHDEKILSWDLVLDHSPTKDALLKVDRQLAVVEMEGAGFLKAVASHAKHYISRPWRTGKAGGADALVVRGISDPAADKSATDAGHRPWRQIAARNAIQTILLLIDDLTERDFGAPERGA